MLTNHPPSLPCRVSSLLARVTMLEFSYCAKSPQSPSLNKFTPIIMPRLNVPRPESCTSFRSRHRCRHPSSLAMGSIVVWYSISHPPFSVSRPPSPLLPFFPVFLPPATPYSSSIHCTNLVKTLVQPKVLEGLNQQTGKTLVRHSAMTV